MMFSWCYHDVIMTLWCCYHDVIMMMLWWYYDNVIMMMLLWCYHNVIMMSSWCLSWWVLSGCYRDVIMILSCCMIYSHSFPFMLSCYYHDVWYTLITLPGIQESLARVTLPPTDKKCVPRLFCGAARSSLSHGRFISLNVISTKS